MGRGLVGLRYLIFYKHGLKNMHPRNLEEEKTEAYPSPLETYTEIIYFQ